MLSRRTSTPNPMLHSSPSRGRAATLPRIPPPPPLDMSRALSAEFPTSLPKRSAGMAGDSRSEASVTPPVLGGGALRKGGAGDAKALPSPYHTFDETFMSPKRRLGSAGAAESISEFRLDGGLREEAGGQGAGGGGGGAGTGGGRSAVLSTSARMSTSTASASASAPASAPASAASVFAAAPPEDILPPWKRCADRGGIGGRGRAVPENQGPSSLPVAGGGATAPPPTVSPAADSQAVTSTADVPEPPTVVTEAESSAFAEATRAADIESRASSKLSAAAAAFGLGGASVAPAHGDAGGVDIGVGVAIEERGVFRGAAGVMTQGVDAGAPKERGAAAFPARMEADGVDDDIAVGLHSASATAWERDPSDHVSPVRIAGEEMARDRRGIEGLHVEPAPSLDMRRGSDGDPDGGDSGVGVSDATAAGHDSGTIGRGSVGAREEVEPDPEEAREEQEAAGGFEITYSDDGVDDWDDDLDPGYMVMALSEEEFLRGEVRGQPARRRDSLLVALAGGAVSRRPTWSLS